VRSHIVVLLEVRDELIGAVSIYGQQVRPFTEKQIELVQASPARPSSRWRTRNCSMSCGNL
jgi:hypothetical protein